VRARILKISQIAVQSMTRTPRPTANANREREPRTRTSNSSESSRRTHDLRRSRRRPPTATQTVFSPPALLSRVVFHATDPHAAHRHYGLARCAILWACRRQNIENAESTRQPLEVTSHSISVLVPAMHQATALVRTRGRALRRHRCVRSSHVSSKYHHQPLARHGAKRCACFNL